MHKATFDKGVVKPVVKEKYVRISWADMISLPEIT